MKSDEILQMKYALTALDRVGRLTEEAIINHVALAQCQPLPTMDGQHLIRKMTEKGWIGSFTDPVLERVYHAITVHGRNALLSL